MSNLPQPASSLGQLLSSALEQVCFSMHSQVGIIALQKQSSERMSYKMLNLCSVRVCLWLGKFRAEQNVAMFELRGRALFFQAGGPKMSSERCVGKVGTGCHVQEPANSPFNRRGWVEAADVIVQ